MKALIIYPTGETEPAHSTAVKQAFIDGGGVTADLYNITTFNQTVVDYARTNDYDAIMYSYSGEESYFSLANSNTDIMIFMPSDSYTGDLQQLVLTDLATSTDDYEFLDNTQSAVSYSNGYICGQLFYIASQRNCSLQEARICANATKDEDGIIDVASAIAYSGTIALTVGDITAERTDTLTVSLALERITDATNYRIKVTDLSGNLIEYVETTALAYEYTLPDYGVYLFNYMGYTSDLESNYSDTVQEGQVKFTFFLIQEEDMAFGLAVSDYAAQQGSYGTIIKVNISAELPYAINWVRGESVGEVKSDPVSTGVSLQTLYSYLESSTCPDIAWSFNGVTLSIFFKTGEYDTRFAFEEYRHSKLLSAVTDYIDVPEDLLPLFRLYVMRSIQHLKGYEGSGLTTSIDTEESKFETA